MLKTLGQKIRYIRGNMSAKEFARLLNVTPSYIYMLESGKSSMPSLRFIRDLCEKFNVSEQWLLSDEDEVPCQPAPPSVPIRPVPIVAKVPAGYPDEACEIVKYEALPGAPPNAKAMEVKGDSMSPTIKDGDYVIWVDNIQCKHNDIVIIADEWGDIALKRMKVKEGQITFTSDNPEYPPIVPNEHFRLIGKVIKIVRVIEPK